MSCSSRWRSELVRKINMRTIRFINAALAAWLLCAAAASAAPNARLADAAEQADFEAVRVLLARDADVNAPQSDGMTALHWAAHHDDASLVKQLIAAGAEPNASNRYGISPLAIACINGNTAIVELLLEAGADSNSSSAGGETALMTASRTGRLGPVAALIASGADVNARERNGQTALMWAAAEGHVEVVDALVTAGADFRKPLPSGFTPLLFAAREGRADAVTTLLDAGADVNEILRPAKSDDPPYGSVSNALILAVENGHFELAAELIEAGADPNAHPGGYTALHAITWVRKPLRGDGNPPPIGSGNLNSLELVRRLVEHKADLNARLEYGKPELGRFTTTGATPFWMAARASDVALIKLLVERGADTNIPNAENCTPLLAAVGVGALSDGDESAGTDEEAIEAVRVLLEHGAEMNAVDDNGETAMHGAAYQSRAALVPLLVEHGADINTWNRKNTSGWTPLMIAQGHRPANFRPSPDTIAAIERAMRAAGVEPPAPVRADNRPKY
jgi:ankyrin repeat protein